MATVHLIIFRVQYAISNTATRFEQFITADTEASVRDTVEAAGWAVISIDVMSAFNVEVDLSPGNK